jgi:hypothetical protein
MSNPCSRGCFFSHRDGQVLTAKRGLFVELMLARLWELAAKDLPNLINTKLKCTGCT